MTHELKTWPGYFEAVWIKRKRFELRKNDRCFQEGDTLHLREWCPTVNAYTGRECWADVHYVLRSCTVSGLLVPETVVMSIEVTRKAGVPR